MMYLVVAVLWGLLGWYLARLRSTQRAHDAGYALGRAIEAQRQRDVSRQELERHFQTGHRIGQHELRAFLATLPVEELAGWVHHPLHDPVRSGTLGEFAPRVVEVDS